MATDPGFAHRLRELREQRGLSTRGLAELAHFGKSYVNDLERGVRTPTEASARQLDEHLEAGGELLRLAGCEPAAEGPALLRTDLGMAEPMGDADVEQLHKTVGHLVALDTAHGSGGLADSATRAFRTSQLRLASDGVREPARGDLHAALAELGEVAAWLSYDDEQHDVSRTVATEAMLIAQLVGDTSMVRFLMSHLAMQAVYLDRPNEALDLTGRVIADEPRSQRVIGMMRVRRARALGKLGNLTEALRELEQARVQLEGGVGPDDPAWTWWWHGAELAVHEGRIRSSAGDRTGAVAASEQSVLLLPPGQGRDHALFRAWLLSDLVDVKAWRDAELVASELLKRAPVVGSARVPRVIRLATRRALREGAPAWLVDAMHEAAAAAGHAA